MEKLTVNPTQTSQRVKPIIVDYPQRSPEWRQARLGNVTGSEAKKCFYDIGVNAHNALIRDILNVRALTKPIKESDAYKELISRNAFELFQENNMVPPEPGPRTMYRRLKIAERLTGQEAEPEDRFMSYDMKWGTMTEPLAKAKYALETGNLITEAPFLLHPEIRAGASPDGFVTERSTGLLGVVECKCLRSHNQLYDVIRSGEIPEEYMVQIHMEIWISGRDFCDFIAFDPRLPKGLELFIKRVERDDDYIDKVLEPEIRMFLDDCQTDENYFRMKVRKEIERRKKEGIIIMPARENILEEVLA